MSKNGIAHLADKQAGSSEGASMEQRLRYTELAPAGIAAMRAVEHYTNTASGLEPVLLELIRLRTSLLNGCDYCIGLHTHELIKHNEPQSRIDGVEEWQDSDAFTQRERAAFAWTEAVTNIQDGHASEEAYGAVREHFSEVELVNLTIAITSINAWNRMAIAFRAVHTPKTDVIGDDGGKVVEE